MTTTVGLALTKALDAAPGKGWNMDQKIHHYLKDHPNKTKEEIAKALGFPSIGSTYAALKRAMREGLLRKQRGTRFTKGVWEYQIVFKEFQQPSWGYVKVADRVKPDKPNQEIKTGINWAPETEKPPKFDIDSLTLGEARKLYNDLHKMFGGGK